MGHLDAMGVMRCPLWMAAAVVDELEPEGSSLRALSRLYVSRIFFLLCNKHAPHINDDV